MCNSAATSASAIAFTTLLRRSVERALRLVRVVAKDEVGDHPPEHRVAEELQPLVAVVVLGLGHPRAVAHRAA